MAELKVKENGAAATALQAAVRGHLASRELSQRLEEKEKEKVLREAAEERMREQEQAERQREAAEVALREN